MIFYILLFLFIIFIVKFGIKKGFNQLETYLMLQFIVFLFILKFNPKIAIGLIITSKQFRFSVIFTLLVFNLLIQQNYKGVKSISSFIYKDTFTLKHNLDKLPKTPTIIVANYPCNYVEYLAQGLFYDKMCLMLHKPAIAVLKYIFGRKNLIGVSKGEFDKLQNVIDKKVKEGYSIFSYVEREYHTRKDDYSITDIRSGVFRIAKNLKIPITPVVIDHIEHINGIVENYTFNIIVDDTRLVENIEEETTRVSSFFKKNLKKLMIKKVI